MPKRIRYMNGSDPVVVDDFLRESNAIEGEFSEDFFLQAQKAWGYIVNQEHLTRTSILRTHEILMQNSNLKKNEIGSFRQCKVWIAGREGMLWWDIEDAIKKWCEATENPEADAIDMHVAYEHIHPFVDGNGRTGRIFMNWMLHKQGKPLWVIHHGAEQYEYYKIFKEKKEAN